MINLCAPAVIYLIFSIIQILIDTIKGLYNTAFIKIIVAIMVTLLLNILCLRGLGIVSWIIVFIPFILMTVVVSMLLYIFGLDATTGNLKYQQDSNNNINNISGVTMDALGNIIVYDPKYNIKTKPIYYQSPNLIITNPNTPPVNNNTNMIKTNYNNIIVPHGTSSPEYQS